MLLLFLCLVIICFTFPGVFLLEKSKANINFWEKVILGTVVGIIFSSLLSYLLLVLRMHFLLLPAIFSTFLLSLKQIPFRKYTISFLSKKKVVLLIIVFTLGIIGQLLVIAPSGIYSKGDLVFWSSHGHDGLWHISLMNEINKGFPLQNPVFAGERLVNYHFFSDIALADFNHYFKLPALDLYFRYFPLLFSVLLGALTYFLAVKLGGNFQTGIWAVIFTYFAGSFGYIVTFLQNRTLGGESLFWATQVQSSIGNPPQIAAFIIILSFLYLVNVFLNQGGKLIFLICTMLVGSLAVFKIYGAIVVLISLGLAGLWQIIKERKLHILFLFLSSASLSAILHLPNSSNSGSFLIWEPWWFIRTMVVAPDRLNWIDLELKRQTYLAQGNLKRVLQIEITAFFIFFFGNLGMRFLGLFSFIRFAKNSVSSLFSMLIIFIVLISLIFPLLFLQKGVASNTIQFLQYFLLLLGILSSITLNQISKRIKDKSLNILLIFLIIIFSIPTQIALISNFYGRSPLAKIEKEELSALNWLKQNTKISSIILTPPYDKNLSLNDPVPHIWDWSDTSYVSALSERRIYLEDLEQVDIMGYKSNERLKFQNLIFLQQNIILLEEELKNQKIDYLYFPIPLRPKIDLAKTSLRKVFSNSVIEIWEI